MTYARSILIPPGSPGTFHCVSRCVRAFLCGEDRLTGRSFEHRRQWVEDRIHELADIFGVAIWGYAVMSNHLHVVVETLTETVARWSDDEVAQRWMRLYPRQDQDSEMRGEVRAGNAERIKELRERLSNLSWFMRLYVFHFGIAEDLPMPAAYDGDGKADIAVFRPSSNAWYRINSTNGSSSVRIYGTSGDNPLPATVQP